MGRVAGVIGGGDLPTAQKSLVGPCLEKTARRVGGTGTSKLQGMLDGVPAREKTKGESSG